MQNTENTLEAILFWKNEPVAVEKLAAMAGISLPEAEGTLKNLEGSLGERGITLVRIGEKIALRTSPDASKTIENLQKEELSKELSKAALETLTIVLYRYPVKRSEVDYIRGVNSQFIIRHLESRGLIEKMDDPKDSRVNLYRPTFELFSFLGIKDEKELPEFDALREKAEEFALEEVEVALPDNKELQ